jgi:hypothetical protein
MAWRLIKLSTILLLSGCSRFSPHIYDEKICLVVDANWGWSSALKATHRQYKVPPGLVMSVIFNESSFRAQARPKRENWLGIIPWRVSSAYGYGQIKDVTWAWYKAHNAGWFQSRTNFSDTADFIGWYYRLFMTKNALDDASASQIAKSFYLAYHEGLGGYSRKSYDNNQWLLDKAQKVSERAISYDKQLQSCL